MQAGSLSIQQPEQRLLTSSNQGPCGLGPPTCRALSGVKLLNTNLPEIHVGAPVVVVFYCPLTGAAVRLHELHQLDCFSSTHQNQSEASC